MSVLNKAIKSVKKNGMTGTLKLGFKKIKIHNIEKNNDKLIRSSKIVDLNDAIYNKKINIVSFDLFDTLVLRPCLSPDDVFGIICKKSKFSKNAFTLMHNYSDQEAHRLKGAKTTINDIYEIMHQTYNIDEKCIDELRDAEIQFNVETTRPRNFVKELFLKCKTLKKKVIITTDTYFDKNTIHKILEKCEITGYDELFISNEIDKRKDDGTIYCHIIDYFNCKPENILHIGDNIYSDVKNPSSKGIMTWYCPSPSQLLQKSAMSKYKRYCYENADNQILWGIYANLIYDNPHNEIIDGVLGNNPYQLGLFMGPMLVSFTKWMIELTKKLNIDKLLLCYRDGYLIEKILPHMLSCAEINLEYEEIHLPRIIRQMYTVCDNNGILESICEIKPEESMNISDFIKYRLYLDNEKDAQKAIKIVQKYGYMNKNEKIGDISKIALITPDLEQIVKDNIVTKTEMVSSYCEKKFSKNNTAVFDIGYRGSICRFLNVYLKRQTYELQMLANSGIFLNAYSEFVESYITYPMKLSQETKIFENFMENILSSQEPELLSIVRKNEKFEYIFGPEEPNNQTIDEVQTAIIEYVRHTVDILGNRIYDLCFDRFYEFSVLTDRFLLPTDSEVSIICKLTRKDSSQIRGSTAGQDNFGWWKDTRGKSA